MLRNALNFFMKFIKEIKNEKWNIKHIKEEFLDLLFPPVCGICGKIHEEWICEKCYQYICRFKIVRKKIKLHRKNNRYNILKKYKKDNKKYVKQDEKTHYKKVVKKVKNGKKFNYKSYFFDKLLYMFPYKKIVRKLMLQYKFNQKAYLSNLFTTIILKDEIYCRKIKHYDIMIPVPMFKKKKKQRGYNQTELIAEKICSRLNISLGIDCLIKIKNTKVQSTLSAYDRKENIKNAFLVNNIDKIQNKKIIVFDDIFTTGETVNEISRVLKQAGAKEILVIVIAKD